MLLGIAFGPAVIAACFALLTPERGGAYNEYSNEYRKWPWRAGSWHSVSGGCGLGGIFNIIVLPA